MFSHAAKIKEGGCYIKFFRIFFVYFSYIFRMFPIKFLSWKATDFAPTVSLGANNPSIKNCSLSYRMLAMIPSRSKQVADRAPDAWHARRNREITHEAMHAILTELKPHLERKTVMLFADGKYRTAWPYLDFLNMDGAEVAAHTLCNPQECPVCDVPKAEMARTDRPLKLRTSKSVRKFESLQLKNPI